MVVIRQSTQLVGIHTYCVLVQHLMLLKKDKRVAIFDINGETVGELE